MHIYYDNIVFSGQKSGGISVVWYELLKRIINDKSINIRFLDNNSLDNHYRRMLNLNEYDKDKDWLYPLSSIMPVSVHSDCPFIFHSSYYRYCNNPKAVNITTVHDFTYEYFRRGLAKLKHCWCKYRALRNSDYIVCISENTKQDLIRFLPDIDEKKIRVIYNGVSEDYYQIRNGDASEGLLFPQGEYLVFVGNRKRYKNFDLTIRSVAQTNYKLVIVGQKLDEIERKEVERYLPREKYVDTGFLSNEKLNELYNYAAALVYPSSYEGFGIPVLEAQRAGCPVIAYNGSSIPEIIGKTPLLMHELSEKELFDKISILSDKQLVEEIRKTGLENSMRFSWDNMYRQYMDLYKEALGHC